LRWLARSGRTTLELPEPSWAAAGLRAGDDVVIEVEDGELLHAALRAYLPPLAGLIAGPVAAGFAAPGSEPAALAAALVGLLLGWRLARAWLVRVPPRYRLRPAEQA
jgi:positive regulator of sigma E activity